MKRYLVIIVALILVLALFGCGKDKTTTVENDTGTVENNDTVEDEAESAEAESAEASNSDDDSSGSDSGLISPEFKKTMDDYEAWFDHYCDVMERYCKS